MAPVREVTHLVDTERKGLAVAIPSSVLDTQHKPILKTYLCGQIARALAVFRVEEIIIYNEEAAWEPYIDLLFSQHKNFQSNSAFMARNLLMAECPQYLKKSLFPMHVDVRDCGAMPPLMIPSHPLADDMSLYREGVVISEDEEAQSSNQVECGIWRPATIPIDIPTGRRVTLKMNLTEDGTGYPGGEEAAPTATPVAMQEARQNGEQYWGYTVRTASSLSEAIGTDEKYDLVIGTSERGEDISTSASTLKIPQHYRPLLVLGGPKGLEAAIEGDPVLKGSYPEDVFHMWVNALPDQGSKTIRTEEALIMCLTALKSKW